MKGEGENKLEGNWRPILLITALIWWETLTALDGNNTQELQLVHSPLPPRLGVGWGGVAKAKHDVVCFICVFFVVDVVGQADC